MRAPAPYYVAVTVRNAGDSRPRRPRRPALPPRRPDTLVASWTPSRALQACPSRPLPRLHARHEGRRACLVYLVPAPATRPRLLPADQDFDPITWIGKVAGAAPKKASSRAKKPGPQHG